MPSTTKLAIAATLLAPSAALASAPIPAPLAGAFGPVGLVAAGGVAAAVFIVRKMKK